MLSYIIIVILSYLLGSITSGTLVSRIFKLGDVRKKGSGNIGATNIWRVGGKLPGALTFFFDFLKGVLAVYISNFICSEDSCLALAGIASVLGHNFPIWLNFKGGKGVATTIGVLMIWSPLVGCFFITAWLFTFLLYRYVSLASITAMVISCITGYYVFSGILAATTLALTLLLVFKHKENIQRLRSGKELKM